MASQSAIAEGGSVVTADQINYQQKMFSHPSYRFEPQFSNTFGAPINLSSASQIPVTINLPPEVFNLAQSYLTYSVNLPAIDATHAIWTARQALKEISHIQFYTGSGMWIVDLDNLQNYLDITLKKELDQDEFLSLDELTGIYASNSPINVVPARRNSNITNITTAGRAPTDSKINYTEPGYFDVAPLNTAVTYDVSFPLRLIKNTAFSIDKNMYLGQTSYLKLYFGPLSKIAFSSTTLNNPSAGVNALYTGAGTIGGGNTPGTAGAPVTPINLQLMLAVECNQDLRTMIINQVSTSGLSYLIPYVQAFKTNNSGTSQTVSIQLDQGNGRSLMKVYHSIYNSFEQEDCMYDHANTALVAGAIDVASPPNNQKVAQYYTQLNGKREQDITLDCTYNGPFLDYMQHRRQLRGSILSNRDVFQYNWLHCSDYCDFGPRYDQDNKGELISGIPMSVAPLTWSFVGTIMRAANNAFFHYTWFVFVKKLTMSPGQVIVQ